MSSKCVLCGTVFTGEGFLGCHIVEKHDVATLWDHGYKIYRCQCGWSTSRVFPGDLKILRREMTRLSQHTAERGHRCAKNARCQRELSLL